MKRLVIGGVIVVIALSVAGAVTAVTLSRPAKVLGVSDSVETAVGDRSPANVPRNETPARRGGPLGDEEGTAKPYIGVAARDLPTDSAEELDLAGGAVVWRVFEDGPSAGRLEKGDIIVAVGGTEVTGVEHLQRLVSASQPGDQLLVKVIRDQEPLEVTLAVGERETPLHRLRTAIKRHRGPTKTPDLRLPGIFGHGLDDLLRAEVVFEGDDGPETIAAVAGTIRDIDVNADTIVLEAKDGSGEFLFNITDRTLIISRGELGADNEALVVASGDEARFVVQGDHLEGRHARAFVGAVPRLRGSLPRLGDLHHLHERSGEAVPFKLRERLRLRLSD